MLSVCIYLAITAKILVRLSRYLESTYPVVQRWSDVFVRIFYFSTVSKWAFFAIKGSRAMKYCSQNQQLMQKQPKRIKEKSKNVRLFCQQHNKCKVLLRGVFASVTALNSRVPGSIPGGSTGFFDVLDQFSFNKALVQPLQI